MMQRCILHIDFDSYFASVEQQDHPEFRGKPLGVTATNGRTCIIAASREAKKKGIKSPSSTYDAVILCPDIQFTRANFNRYWEISKQFIKICKDYSPFIEVFSLDELFMDVTKTAHLFGGVAPLINQLKKRIKEEIGEYITVSIGIAENKLLAKLASGLKKPNGICVIPSEKIYDTYATCELTDICGIGPRIERRLNQMGVYSLLQLEKTPLSSLIAEFGGVEGNFLYNVGKGIDYSPVIPYTEAPGAKSVGRNYCLPGNEYNERVVFQHVYELCEEIGIKLRRIQRKARRVSVFLAGSIHVYSHKTSHLYLQSGKELFSQCFSQITNPHSGFYDIDKERRYVRKIGIGVSLLTEEAYIPQDLFGEKKRQDTLVKLTDEINERFGDHTIRNGFLLYAQKLTTVPNGFMADRYERQLLAQELI